MQAVSQTPQRFDAARGTWARVFRVFFALVPTPAVRAMRKAVQIGPIEELVIVGRKSGHERRVLIVLAQVGSFWYVGHPNADRADWVLNLIAAGRARVITRAGANADIEPVSRLKRPYPSARATAKSSRQGATLAAVRQRASVRSAFPAAAPEEAAWAKLDPAKLRTEIPAARTAASMPARPYIRDGRDSRRGPEGTAASSPRFAKRSAPCGTRARLSSTRP